MTYPCGIIQDIMPLYIDNACSPESKAALEAHLPQCPGCRACLEAMKAPENFADGLYRDPEDTAMESGLKKAKKRINKRLLLSILAASALCLVIFHLLFNAPLKKLSPEDISFSASVYAIDQLPRELNIDENTVQIFADQGDTSPSYRITVPAMPNAEFAVSGDLMEKYKYITVISHTSLYHIREMGFTSPLTEEEEPTTLYLESARTTLLNNKAPANLQSAQTLHFGEVNKIIFLEDDGTEMVLWEQPEA